MLLGARGGNLWSFIIWVGGRRASSGEGEERGAIGPGADDDRAALAAALCSARDWVWLQTKCRVRPADEHWLLRVRP